MPRTYQPGLLRPSPSGLACELCGRSEASSWRGPDSRYCSRSACKVAAFKASAVGTHEVLHSQATDQAGELQHTTGVRVASVALVADNFHVAMAIATPGLGPLELPLAKPTVALASVIPCGAATATIVLVAPRQECVHQPEPEPEPEPEPQQQEQEQQPVRRVPLGCARGAINGATGTAIAAARDNCSVVLASGGLCAYELERLKNVERNNAKLRALGLLSSPRPAQRKLPLGMKRPRQATPRLRSPRARHPRLAAHVHNYREI